MKNITISNFINNEYKDYANYVLSSRAIPSLIDGMKTSQRKVIYTALKHALVKRVKTAALSGMVVAYAGYHHGSASLDGAISLMTPDWKNNIPLFDGEGNFGSRLINDSAAARYTFVKLHSNFINNFVDRDLVEYYQSEDPEAPEPLYYLPLVPWVLIQGIKGIAVGHATEIQPYNIKDIKKLCIDHLNGKDIKDNLKPFFNSFSGKVIKDGLGVRCEGVVEIKNSTTAVITELPINYQREQYILILDKLESEGKIVSYVDKCCAGKFKFEVKFKRNQITTVNKLIKVLKLTYKLNENLTTIDENNKLKIFNNKIEIIKHFCDWRLKQFNIRYKHYIKRDSEKLKNINLKIEYINAINSGLLVISNVSKKQLENSISNMLGANQEKIEMLINLPIHNLTETNKNKLIDIKETLEYNINKYKNINFKKQYIKELKEL